MLDLATYDARISYSSIRMSKIKADNLHIDMVSGFIKLDIVKLLYVTEI